MISPPDKRKFWDKLCGQLLPLAAWDNTWRHDVWLVKYAEKRDGERSVQPRDISTNLITTCDINPRHQRLKTTWVTTLNEWQRHLWRLKWFLIILVHETKRVKVGSKTGSDIIVCALGTKETEVILLVWKPSWQQQLGPASVSYWLEFIEFEEKGYSRVRGSKRCCTP